MRRKSLQDAACPIARSLDDIGEWWSLLIVRDAVLGKRRFGEFHKSLGLAKNVLADRLRKLVARGILEAVPAGDGRARHEYRLTEKGRDLGIVLLALRMWGGRWLPRDGRAQVLVDRATGERVRLELRTANGRAVQPGDLVPRAGPRSGGRRRGPALVRRGGRRPPAGGSRRVTGR